MSVPARCSDSWAAAWSPARRRTSVSVSSAITMPSQSSPPSGAAQSGSITASASG